MTQVIIQPEVKLRNGHGLQLDLWGGGATEKFQKVDAKLMLINMALRLEVKSQIYKDPTEHTLYSVTHMTLCFTEAHAGISESMLNFKLQTKPQEISAMLPHTSINKNSVDTFPITDREQEERAKVCTHMVY